MTKEAQDMTLSNILIKPILKQSSINLTEASSINLVLLISTMTRTYNFVNSMTSLVAKI